MRAALLTLPKKFYAQNDGKMDQEWEQGLLSEIGFIKNIGKLPADFTSEYVSRQEFMRIFVSFQKQLAQEKKLDLDDFAAAVCHLFRTNPAELAPGSGNIPIFWWMSFRISTQHSMKQ